MKLVILAAAIIVGKAVSDPNWMTEHKMTLFVLVASVMLWECYDIWNKNKKQ